MGKSIKNLITYIDNRKTYSNSEIEEKEIMSKKQIMSALRKAKILSNYKYRGLKAIGTDLLLIVCTTIPQIGTLIKDGDDKSSGIIQLTIVWIALLSLDILSEIIYLVLNRKDLKLLTSKGIDTLDIQNAIKKSEYDI